MGEDLIRKLLELNQQLKDLDHTIESNMAECRSYIVRNTSNKLRQCEWKMKKLERSIESISTSPLVVSKKRMKVKLGF